MSTTTAIPVVEYDNYPFIHEDTNKLLSRFISETVHNPVQCIGNDVIKIYQAEAFCNFTRIHNFQNLKSTLTSYYKNKSTTIIDLADVVVKKSDLKTFLLNEQPYRSIMMNKVPIAFNYKIDDNVLQRIDSDIKLSVVAQKLTVFKGGYFNCLHVDENNYGNLNWMPSFCEGSVKIWFFPKKSTVTSNSQLLHNFEQQGKFSQLLTLIDLKAEFDIIVQYPGFVLEFSPCGIPHAVLTVFNSSINKQMCALQVALITSTYKSWWTSIANPLSNGKKRPSVDFSTSSLPYQKWKEVKKAELMKLITEGNLKLFTSIISIVFYIMYIFSGKVKSDNFAIEKTNARQAKRKIGADKKRKFLETLAKNRIKRWNRDNFDLTNA